DEVVGRDEAGGRTGCGILSSARTPQTGRTVRAVVPVPLPGPLLLRPPRRPRLHDRPRVRGRSPDAVRTLPVEGETAIGRSMGTRCDPPGRRGRYGRILQEEPERHAHAVRPRESGRTEQDDHPPRPEGPSSTRTDRMIARERVPIWFES